jgi:hypothetical protein
VPSFVGERRIDQNGYWTPRSVSISQTGSPSLEGGATASIAVGGEGESAVKIFKYRYMGAWNVLNDRVVLRCPQNNGAVKVVGFSPCRNDAIYGSMVFALTTGNHFYCWVVARNVGYEQNSRLEPCWHIDCNARSNERAYRDEITNAAFITSPNGRPYILCTVDHTPGSFLPTTFLVGIDTLESNPHILRQSIRPIPDKVVGSSVVAGVASFNGRFVVVVEKGKNRDMMKLLALQGAPGGGLTCSATQMQTWEVKLQTNTAGSSKISIMIEEQDDALEIIAVDGRGHVVYSSVRVPGMPKNTILPIALPRSSIISELPFETIRRELSSDESSRHSVTTSHRVMNSFEIAPG